MKRYFAIFIILSLLQVSCDKKENQETPFPKGEWQQLSGIFPGLSGRIAPSVCATKDTLIYGLGDYPYSEEKLFSDLWLYTREGWQYLSDFPGQKRVDPLITLLGGKIYVGLGYLNYLKPETANKSGYYPRYKDIWTYDLATKMWDSLPFEFPGTSRAGALYFQTDHKIYYGAGRSGDSFLSTNDMYVFDPSQGWRTATPEFVERQSDMSAFVLGREIYTCFGLYEGGYNRVVRKFSSTEKKWESVCLFKKTEYPAIARRNAKTFVLKEKEGEFAYILGGKMEKLTTEDPLDDYWLCCRFDPRTCQLEKINPPDTKNIEAAFTIENTGYIFDGTTVWKYIP